MEEKMADTECTTKNSWLGLLVGILLSALVVGSPPRVTASEQCQDSYKGMKGIVADNVEQDFCALANALEKRFGTQLLYFDEVVEAQRLVKCQDDAGQSACERFSQPTDELISKLKLLRQALGDCCKDGKIPTTEKEWNQHADRLEERASIIGLRDFCRLKSEGSNFHSWIATLMPQSTDIAFKKSLESLDKSTQTTRSPFYGPPRRSVDQPWEVAWTVDAYSSGWDKPRCSDGDHPWDKNVVGHKEYLNYVTPIYTTFKGVMVLVEVARCEAKLAESESSPPEKGQELADVVAPKAPAGGDVVAAGNLDSVADSVGSTGSSDADGKQENPETGRGDVSDRTRTGHGKNRDMRDAKSTSDGGAGGEEARNAKQPPSGSIDDLDGPGWGWLIFLVLFCLAVGGVVLVLYVSRKRRQKTMGEISDAQPQKAQPTARISPVDGERTVFETGSLQDEGKESTKGLKNMIHGGLEREKNARGELESRVKQLAAEIGLVKQGSAALQTQQLRVNDLIDRVAGLEPLAEQLQQMRQLQAQGTQYLKKQLEQLRGEQTGGQWMVDFVEKTRSPLTDTARAVRESLVLLQKNGVTSFSNAPVRPLFGSAANQIVGYLTGQAKGLGGGGNADVAGAHDNMFTLIVQMVEEVRKSEQGKNTLATQAGSFKVDAYKVWELAKWGCQQLMSLQRAEEVRAQFVQTLQPVAVLGEHELTYPRPEDFFDENYHETIREEPSGDISYGRIVETLTPGLVNKDQYLVERAGVVYSSGR